MDRRQQKTRSAIFSAFSRLLEKKPYHEITVQEIINEANIGRSTFYAHFETKDDLLKSLCSELFDHINHYAEDKVHTYCLYCKASDPDSIFLHILQHLEKNDLGVLTLLSCESNELFLRYFKESMSGVINSQLLKSKDLSDLKVPREFLINHISGSFVDMVEWWLTGGQKETPRELDVYFRSVIEPLL